MDKKNFGEPPSKKEKRPSASEQPLSLNPKLRKDAPGDEAMREDGKFPVEMVRGGYKLLDLITHNEQHQNLEDKRSFVYLIDGDQRIVNKELNLGQGRDIYKFLSELQETVRRRSEILEKMGLIEGEIDREAAGEKYKITPIDGTKVRGYFPEIWELIPKFQALAERLWGDRLVPLHDKAALNINIVSVGGEQGFHYDRNEVTILLYLSDSLGGDLEFKPDSKTDVQFVLARKGELVALVGANKIYHRVTEVQKASAGGKRIALAFGFGLPGVDYDTEKRDNYLYTKEKIEPGEQKVLGKKQ